MTKAPRRDPQYIKQVNAAFDELWKEREQMIATLPAFVQETARSFYTREKALATAYAVVDAVNKAKTP